MNNAVYGIGLDGKGCLRIPLSRERCDRALVIAQMAESCNRIRENFWFFSSLMGFDRIEDLKKEYRKQNPYLVLIYLVKRLHEKYYCLDRVNFDRKEALEEFVSRCNESFVVGDIFTIMFMLFIVKHNSFQENPGGQKLYSDIEFVLEKDRIGEKKLGDKIKKQNEIAILFTDMRIKLEELLQEKFGSEARRALDNIYEEHFLYINDEKDDELNKNAKELKDSVEKVLMMFKVFRSDGSTRLERLDDLEKVRKSI